MYTPGLDGDHVDEPQAIVDVAMMLGAMILARVVDDKALSEGFSPQPRIILPPECCERAYADDQPDDRHEFLLSCL